MRVTELEEFVRTGFERKFLITMTDRDEMMAELGLQWSTKDYLTAFANRFRDALLDLLMEKYSEQLANESSRP